MLEKLKKVTQENEELKYKLKEKICFEGHQQFKELQKNSILKSRIKEKIEELQIFEKLSSSCWDNDTDYKYVIEVLQELLESNK